MGPERPDEKRIAGDGDAPEMERSGLTWGLRQRSGEMRMEVCSLKILTASSLIILTGSKATGPDGPPAGRQRILPQEEARGDRSHDETTHPHSCRGGPDPCAYCV